MRQMQQRTEQAIISSEKERPSIERRFYRVFRWPETEPDSEFVARMWLFECDCEGAVNIAVLGEEAARAWALCTGLDYVAMPEEPSGQTRLGAMRVEIFNRRPVRPAETKEQEALRRKERNGRIVDLARKLLEPPPIIFIPLPPEGQRGMCKEVELAEKAVEWLLRVRDYPDEAPDPQVLSYLDAFVGPEGAERAWWNKR